MIHILLQGVMAAMEAWDCIFIFLPTSQGGNRNYEILAFEKILHWKHNKEMVDRLYKYLGVWEAPTMRTPRAETKKKNKNLIIKLNRKTHREPLKERN